jgi:hypothetical protein
MKRVSIHAPVAVILALLTSLTLAAELKPVDAKFMLRGYCYAGSREDKKAFGGYGSSDNMPKRITNQPVKPGAVSLVALPDEVVPFAKSYRGFRLLLINGTKSEVAFYASDSQLPIVMEARDGTGQWRPIEYLPQSDCGNSFHHVFLPSHHYWEFTAPAYGGKTRVTLRFVFQEEKQKPIYSNEFEGSINPAQFSKKQGHTRAGLMDPYRE